MSKYLAVFVLILGLAVYVTTQDQHSAEKSAEQSNNPTSVTRSSVPNKTQTADNAKDTYRNPPRWYGFFTWPEGVTAWAIILTLFAIGDQSKQTAIAAKAARQATEHSIASERAWILATTVICSAGAKDAQEGPTQVFVQCSAKNCGKTAGRVLAFKACLAIGPISDPGQTWDESLYEVDSKMPPRWTILPEKSTALHSPVSGFHSQPGNTIVADLQQGQASFIHGVIRYWDMFSETNRFTRFCYRWDNEAHPPRFLMAGGDRYNQQT